MKVNLALCVCLALLILGIPLAAYGLTSHPEEGRGGMPSQPLSSSAAISGGEASELLEGSKESKKTEKQREEGESLTVRDVPANTRPQASQSGEDTLPVLVPSSSAMAEGEPVSVTLPDSDSFTIYDLTTGELHTLTAEEYTVCAVSAEMPPTFSEEALKAQAVACYTYALRAKYDNARQPDHALNGADFAADPSDWKGYVTREQYLERYGEETGAVYWDTIEQAVKPVLGYVMLYRENPIVAAYHSTCGGMTEDASNVWQGSAPYLVPVESVGDQYAPNYETAELFSPEELKEAFAMVGLMEDSDFSGEPSEWFGDFERSSSGYVTALTLCGEQLDGIDVRGALGLRSSNFTVEYINGSFLFRVCGYGHGVGMSQYGAEYLGKKGEDWKDILRHYYTGITIAKLNQF